MLAHSDLVKEPSIPADVDRSLGVQRLQLRGLLASLDQVLFTIEEANSRTGDGGVCRLDGTTRRLVLQTLIRVARHLDAGAYEREQIQAFATEVARTPTTGAQTIEIVFDAQWLVMESMKLVCAPRTSLRRLDWQRSKVHNALRARADERARMLGAASAAVPLTTATSWAGAG